MYVWGYFAIMDPKMELKHKNISCKTLTPNEYYLCLFCNKNVTNIIMKLYIFDRRRRRRKRQVINYLFVSAEEATLLKHIIICKCFNNEMCNIKKNNGNVRCC